MRLFAKCLLLVVLLPASAAAYTLVMRGGRRVEINEGFRLSGAQLTYEAAPGVSVSLPLDLVDVAETERANNESPGSFFRRAARNAHERQAAGAQNDSAATARQPARTLTNRELEGVRRARIESERAYERRRAELGLPSAEESRQRDREEEQAMRERARRQEEADANSEAYWRARAAALRGESAALDAEINYLRGLLADTSDDFYSAGFSSWPGLAAAALTINAGGPRRRFGRGSFSGNSPTGTAFARNPANQLLFGGRRFRPARPRAFVGFNAGGGTRVRFGAFKRGPRAHFPRRFSRGRFAHGRSQFIAPGFVGVAAPFDYDSADSVALATRLRLLEAERAGLAARWRQLEEEARRAGAQPGWLRP